MCKYLIHSNGSLGQSFFREKIMRMETSLDTGTLKCLKQTNHPQSTLSFLEIIFFSFFHYSQPGRNKNKKQKKTYLTWLVKYFCRWICPLCLAIHSFRQCVPQPCLLCSYWLVQQQLLSDICNTSNSKLWEQFTPGGNETHCGHILFLFKCTQETQGVCMYTMYLLSLYTGSRVR